MKKKLNAMIAVLLCAACTAPCLPTFAEEDGNDDLFTYDPEQALLIFGTALSSDANEEDSDPVTGSGEGDYYFVTGFGEETVNFTDERGIRNEPCMYFTGVNGNGGIMIRSYIFMYDIERMNDVNFRVGDVFTLVYEGDDEAKADWDETDPDSGCMTFDQNRAWSLRNWFYCGAPQCYWWLSHDAGVCDDDFPNKERVFHFAVTGNLLDDLGSKFTKVCETESAQPRETNINEHMFLQPIPDDVEIIPCVIGDANSDKNVDIIDAIATNKYGMGSRALDDEQLAAADVDKNGIVDSHDSLNILKYTVGELDSFEGLAEK
ncbi:MAG: dockerin type I repeat-containing protein [Oscillospiraceae bacterium]|nr:dockerin type I repeat-containing protein [Oscillospiraceae bacterium]